MCNKSPLKTPDTKDQVTLPGWQFNWYIAVLGGGCILQTSKRYVWDPPRLFSVRLFTPPVLMVPWSRKWQPTPAFLPEKFYGQRSPAGYSPWDHQELDTTERTHTHTISHTKNHEAKPSVFSMSYEYTMIYLLIPLLHVFWSFLDIDIIFRIIIFSQRWTFFSLFSELLYPI